MLYCHNANCLEIYIWIFFPVLVNSDELNVFLYVLLDLKKKK